MGELSRECDRGGGGSCGQEGPGEGALGLQESREQLVERREGGLELCCWHFYKTPPGLCHPVNPARTSIHFCRGRTDSTIWRGSQNVFWCAYSLRIMLTRTVCWHLGKKIVDQATGVAFCVTNSLR